MSTRKANIRLNRKGSSRLFSTAALLLLSYLAHAQLPANIPNPVLPGVADAGVIKYNGEYYIGGVFTKGSFYHSSDLVNWKGPVHVFSMDNAWTDGPSADDSQIHANDINYINGVFHQYWSVNYWGADQHVVHIGHTTARDILGPYKEPVQDHWMDNRIDPALFIDDDGKPYLYMVKFTDGNTIWGRPMRDPWTFAGGPVYQFASLPNTWETLDNRVAEGPWVIKYRDQYYMMYNTNHTSPRWGNYMLGVAQADAPLAFHHGNKYSHPVLQSNQTELEDTYVDVLKYTGHEPGGFRFTMDKPAKNWHKQKFNASSWQTGSPGFGSQPIENSTTRQVKTAWKADEIWLRKSFILDKEQNGKLALRIHHDGDTRVFLNGQPIYQKNGSDYTSWNFDEEATDLLQEGENVLAIHSTKGNRSGFLDVSLFDMQDQEEDDILFSPGQPNIVKGPNGFEWWLVYMANKNQERRGQYINRVHFFNKKLMVEGVSSARTPGYHPLPAHPTFSDLFNTEQTELLQQKWKIRSGSWQLSNKELQQSASEAAEILVNSTPATHYLFEAGVKMSEQGGEQAGVLAWWRDENHWLRVLLDQKNKSWTYILRKDGAEQSESFALSDDFDFHVYHTLGIYKNGTQLMVTIDGLPAVGNPLIQLNGPAGEGIPGLDASGANTAFDGICYTIGWDEFDTQITGWEPLEASSKEKSSWKVAESGITQHVDSGEKAVFKGDALENYEISLQVSSEEAEGSAGIYPVYADENNYLKAVFDFSRQQMFVSGKINGSDLESRMISLEREQSHYADMKYTDFIEKHFTFDHPTHINALRLSQSPHNQPDTLIENIHERMDIFYLQQGQWHLLKNCRQVTSPHPGFDKITFDPVLAEGLKFVNRKADDHQYYVYKIWTNEIFRQSYHLRVARHLDELIFLVDGKEVLQLKQNFPASRVGLVTQEAKAGFNGITFFHLGRQD